jgi:hypothetical protein
MDHPHFAFQDRMMVVDAKAALTQTAAFIREGKFLEASDTVSTAMSLNSARRCAERAVEPPSALKSFNLVVSRRGNYDAEGAVFQGLTLGKNGGVQAKRGEENAERAY